MINRLTVPSPRFEARQMAFKAFEIYKAKGFYNDQNNIVYDFLDEELLIPFTAYEKLEILKEARKKIDRHIQQENRRRKDLCYNEADYLNSCQYQDIPESKLIALQRYFGLLHRENSALPLV